MKLSEELPVEHRLATVHRYGAGVCGAALIVFGSLGVAGRLSPFDTQGTTIAGLSSNGLLSTVSLVFGALLVAGAVVGGNTASTLNTGVGVLFVLSGFVHLALLDRSANILDFGMSNVIFSFAMGLVLMTFGMYGRVSGGLPHDNPYWRRRHPEQAAREARDRRAALAPAAARGRSLAADPGGPS